MNPTLGLAVITKNEEKNIAQCLESVPFAKNKIVVDSLSTDKTTEIATNLGAQVFERKWEGYPKQKQFALDQVNTDWILVLDADEYLSPEAQVEIQKIILNPNASDSYRIPRYEVFMGQIIKYGKGVDHPLRLIKKGKGQYTTREVHEEIIVNGSCGIMKHGMIHKSSVDILSRYEKIKRDLVLEKQYITGETISLTTLFGGPVRFFMSYMIKKKAWKDGVPGVIWLLFFTFQLFLQQALQYEQSLIKKPS